MTRSPVSGSLSTP